MPQSELPELAGQTIVALPCVLEAHLPRLLDGALVRGVAPSRRLEEDDPAALLDQDRDARELLFVNGFSSSTRLHPAGHGPSTRWIGAFRARRYSSLRFFLKSAGIFSKISRSRSKPR